MVFIGFGLWATVVPLEIAARGKGIVQVEGSRKPIQHLEGGFVEEIFVANGDLVSKGQSLIQLDRKLAESEQKIVEARVWGARALVDRLLSERDEADSISFQGWLLEEQDERARTAVFSEQALFDARKASRLGEVSVIEQRISQLESQIDGFTAVIEAKSEVAESIRLERQELQELLSEGYVDKQRIRELDRTYIQLLGELSELRAKVSAAKVAIREATLQIIQFNQRYKTEVVDSLARAQADFYDLKQRSIALNDRLARTLIRAPATGYVLGLKPNVVGAVIQPGSEIMAIVPDVDNLILDVKMSPMDIDRIRVGQEVEARFAVFKDAYAITGVLTKLSADTLIDETTGESYFEAKVELLEEDIALLGPYRLVPGMPAEVVVKTGSRTFLGYLTSPMNRMFENAFIGE